jgi:hypothetical protein
MKKLLILMMFSFFLIFIGACDNSTNSYQVSLEIVADTGIEIALGNLDETPKSLSWKVTLTEQDINKFISKNYEQLNLTYITTSDGKTFQTNGINEESNYLEIPIHFRSNTVNQIRMNSFSINSKEIDVLSPIAFTNSQNILINPGQFLKANIADTIRFSIQDGQNIFAFENKASNTNTVLGYKFESDMTNSNGAIDYYKKATDTYPQGIESVSVVDTITSPSNLLILNMINNQVEQSGKEHYGYIILRVWLEGWDLEAYNIIMGENFRISINFTD